MSTKHLMGAVAAVLFPASASAAPAPGPIVPTTHAYASASQGKNVALSYDQNYKPLVQFSDGQATWLWEPYAGTLSVIAPSYSDFDGWSSFVSYDGTFINEFDVNSGGCISIAKGEHPTTYARNIAWEDGNSSPDRSISFRLGFPSATSTVLKNNGLDEQRPQVFENLVAYEVFNGSWNVGVHNLSYDVPVATVPNLGDERNPDLWYMFVVAELNGNRIIRYNTDSGALDDALVPSGCASFSNPRITWQGEWVAYRATGCASGVDELWLYSFTSNKLWFVDYIASGGSPAYHPLNDWLVYLDANNQVVMRDLDENAI